MKIINRLWSYVKGIIPHILVVVTLCYLFISFVGNLKKEAEQGAQNKFDSILEKAKIQNDELKEIMKSAIIDLEKDRDIRIVELVHNQSELTTKIDDEIESEPRLIVEDQGITENMQRLWNEAVAETRK